MRWGKDREAEDWRAWGIVSAWAAIRGGTGAKPSEHMPYIQEKVLGGGEDFLLMAFGEEDGESERVESQ